jgi:hypothetical protein
MKILYTDIDYVLSLASEPNMKMTKWGWVSPFNKKAVQVYNEIISKTGAEIVISSDWKTHWSLEQLQEIFVEWAGIIKPPFDVTPTIPGVILQKLEEWRAKEILTHVKKYKLESWVAIDDLYLNSWISDENFVWLTRVNEGIKQTGKKEEIIRKLNTHE